MENWQIKKKEQVFFLKPRVAENEVHGAMRKPGL